MPNFLNYTDQQIEAVVNDVYNGVVTRENLPVDLYKDIQRRLNKAVFEGFGGSYENFSEDTTEGLIMSGFEKNIAVFSGAKTFQQVNDMSNFLFNGKDKIPFSEFKKHANEIFETYNSDWLKTEYNTAISQASSGRQWNDIKKQQEIFPLIKYSTIGDGRVRQQHKEFDGIVKPVNDVFWKNYFPPLDWNCRCTSEQLEEGEEPITDVSKLNLPEVPKLFQMNAGEDKIIFDESVHPYFKVDQRYKVALKNNFDLPFKPEVKPAGVKPVKVPKAPKTKEQTAKEASKKILEIPAVLKSEQQKLKINEIYQQYVLKSSEMNKIPKFTEASRKKSAEINDLVNEYNKAKKVHESILKEFEEELIDILKVENHFKELNFSPYGANKKITTDPQITKNLDRFKNFFSEKWQPENKTVNVVLKGKVRASYSKPENLVTLDKNTQTETIFHELGHFMEHDRPELHSQIMEFYNRRTAGDRIEQLSKITGIKGFKPYEVTKKDDFVEPYIGRFYNRPGSSEILTMWFTEVFNNPKRLIEKDFEYFEFIYNLLRQK